MPDATALASAAGRDRPALQRGVEKGASMPQRAAAVIGTDPLSRGDRPAGHGSLRGVLARDRGDRRGPRGETRGVRGARGDRGSGLCAGDQYVVTSRSLGLPPGARDRNACSACTSSIRRPSCRWSRSSRGCGRPRPWRRRRARSSMPGGRRPSRRDRYTRIHREPCRTAIL